MKRRDLLYSGLFLALSTIGIKRSSAGAFVVQTKLRMSGSRSTPLPGELDQILLSGGGLIHGRYQNLLGSKMQSGELLAKRILRKSADELVLQHSWSSENAYRLYRESQETKDVLASLASHGVLLDESCVG